MNAATREDARDRVILRRADVARELGISLRQVYNLTASGDLPCYRRGRVVWFLRRDLIAFVERHRIGGAEGGR